MKKVLSILFVIVFFFNTTGYYYYFHTNQQHIIDAMQNNISQPNNRREIVVFAFLNDQNNNLKWIKKGKEFIYEDVMYDVKKVIIKDSITIYHCFKDIRETVLIAGLITHVKNNMSQPVSKKGASNLLKIFIQDFISEVVISDTIRLENTIKRYFTHNFYKSVIPPVLSPPPKA